MVFASEIFYKMSLKALFYKAFCINRRHYFQTLFIIVFPLIPIIILVSNKAEIEAHNKNLDQDTIIYPKQSKASLLETSDQIFAVFYPKSSFTLKLMDTVKKKTRVVSVGVDKEVDVEKWLIDNNSSTLSQPYFGVIFHVDPLSVEPPKDFRYTLRGNKNSLPDTSQLFPIVQKSGPNEAGATYFYSMFIPLKIAIDESFLNIIGMASPNWTMEEFPYPAHKGGSESNAFDQFIPLILSAAFLYSFISLTSFALNEKKSGITERLRMVGLTDVMILLNYLVHSFLTYIITTFILSILFKIKNGSTAILDTSNFVVIWLVLILFCLQSSAFFIAASALFNNPSLAISITVMIYFVPISYVIPHPNISIPGQIFTSFMPAIYLYWAFQVIYGFEQSGIGATFSTIVKLPSAGHSQLPLLVLMVISLLVSVLFCFIYIYIINVKPGQYGYPKPWYFIFPKKYFCRVNPSKNSNEVNDTSKGLYEKIPENVEVGLHISNLQKRFGNVISVKNLSLDIYVGQITALLGHNGAGKTTTLSMITGMYKPTSGTINYRGYNVFTDLNLFRRDLGLCPQDDMLIGDITVLEHLIIFGLIKRLSMKEILASSEDALRQVGLLPKRDCLVNALSGGMKRKLCIALALVGNPKVLVLDEPTSGLDPESRREIWNILLKFRENRVMIITTHFMEEADVLGDQIAIMDHGEIKCYGSAMFLKKHYGAGYQISLCCSENTNYDEVTQFVLSQIPSASVMNKLEGQIIFNIPSSSSSDFPALFKRLENSEKFHLSRVGINCTTMDDVFLKVREEADNRSSSGHFSSTEDENLFADTPFVSARSTNPVMSFWQRLKAMIVKNSLYRTDKYVSLILTGLILPFYFSYLAVHTGSAIFDYENVVPLTFDLSLYGSTEVLMDGSLSPGLRKAFTDLVQREGHHTVDVKTLNKNNIIDGLLQSCADDELKFRQSMIVAGSFNESVPNVLYSSIAIHAPPIALNLLYNSFLKADANASAYSIATTISPLIFSSEFCSLMSGLEVAIFANWVLWAMGLCSLVGNLLIRGPHTERTSLLKHLLQMTGSSPLTYWLSFFISDFLLYLLCTAFMFVIFKSFDGAGLLALDDASGVLALLMILFGISQFWFTYCFSLVAKTPSGSFNLYFVSCIVVFIASAVCFNFVPTTSNWIIITYILRFIPFGPFSYALQLLIFKAVTKLQCNICTNSYKLPQCMMGNIQGNFIDDNIKKEIIYLGLDWIVYFVILMLFEFGIVAKLWNWINSSWVGLVDSSLAQVESDVAKERDRVDAALNMSGGDGDVGAPIVIVDSLAKKYSRSFTAVYDVSFASKEGECFGLLGVNGAGKSTTFNILSGVIPPTKGRALIKGLDLNRNKRQCLSYIGYCPQSSALGEGLTGRQMLTLFANLRLAQPSHVSKLVDRWIKLLGLGEYADRVCSTYSGGNKRKLSTAMAFINNPAVILLDEPTSGVDPVTRRNLWTVLKNSQNNKQTIIISSHSMDECEAVCDRLTIMARGYMQCIGNIHRLKELYGEGYIILVKLKEHSEAAREALKQRINDVFELKVSLKDEHMLLLHYHINEPNYKPSFLFSVMERVKSDFAIIEEYSISDSSLEHVFLSFAKKKDKA